ncbi:hypothetical protein OG898_30560 [Streptomyces sp. NBC_00193]|uniref:hypothetical protein n=1 Tax=unclassified Streptomyces TaxID=2593676 RepID=UPI0022507B37|nr:MULTISPECIES: hypothetical protein [unclassified Streptomyces]MCX5128364.1 hypothetical protein [Streptomyces sp. NBC_00347]MCX5300756.1 hypothetical protein [Streptomyces sp. NBC_00193]
MFLSTVRGAAVLVGIAAFTVSCGANPESAPATDVSASSAASPSSQGAASTAPTASRSGSTSSALPAERVRDAFAGLQATLKDSCTPGNCAYFLGRVYDELHRMDRAMKADPKGPGHFPEPISLIANLDTALDGDHAFDNLKRHQTLLIGTRDKINVWMQAHPDDYR